MPLVISRIALNVLIGFDPSEHSLSRWPSPENWLRDGQSWALKPVLRANTRP